MIKFGYNRFNQLYLLNYNLETTPPTLISWDWRNKRSLSMTLTDSQLIAIICPRNQLVSHQSRDHTGQLRNTISLHHATCNTPADKKFFLNLTLVISRYVNKAHHCRQFFWRWANTWTPIAMFVIWDKMLLIWHGCEICCVVSMFVWFIIDRTFDVHSQ